GVLAQLEFLEARDRREAAEREQKEQREERTALLHSRIRELRRHRDQLRDQLENWEKGGFGKEGTGADPALPKPGNVLEWRIRRIQSLLRVFQLAGLSGKRGRRGLCLTLGTAYEGSQLESFHLELLPGPEPRIHRHSIPPFIPLERLSRRFLHSDLREFLAQLSQHLNAFVGRRFQAEQLQGCEILDPGAGMEHFSDWIVGTPQQNSLYNLLIFQYNIPGNSWSFPFRARLLYWDPCRSLPTEVVVSCSPDAPVAQAETATDHSELFRRLALHKAFHSLIS
ncbi:CENPO protein, partial [Serilophus lunatus]|nr:CENPO protein [Serilophus lunatus]